MSKHNFPAPLAVLCIACCATLLPLGVAAQKPLDKDTIGTVRNISTVTVTGRQNRTAASAAPLFNIGADKINRFSITDVGNAVKRLPGVNLRDYGGAGGLKTVSVRGLGAAHTAVVYDGVTLSDARNGEIDLSRYSIDNLSNITLRVGDNDDIFQPARSSASAASLFFTTAPATGDDSLHLTAKARAGSFGYASPYIKVTKGFGEKWAANISADFMRADNRYPFRLRNGNTYTIEHRKNSKARALNTEANITFAPRAGSSLTTKLYYYDSRRQLPGPVIYYNDENRERLTERTAFWQSTYRMSFSPTVAFQANAKFNWDASLYSDVNGKYPGGKLNQNYYQREAYASAAALWTPLQGWSFTYAADYAYNSLSSNLPTENHPWRNSVLQSLGARWKNRHLTVTARALGSIYRNGSRSGDAAKNATRLSPSASLSYRPIAGRNLFLRLSYKSIFRMPTFNECYFYHYGSPDVKPENTDQFNAGVTWQWSPAAWLNSLTLTGDAYISNVKDKIVAVPYNMFIWTVVNLGKVRGRGADLTLSADFVPAKGHSVLLAANYSYQRMEPRTNPGSADYGKQVAYVPRHSGGASLSYENPWVNIAANITATSARFTSNENLPQTRLGGYADTGAAIYRPFRLGRYTLEGRLDILNIFNRQYEVIARYPMPGRSFRATVKFEF